MGIDKVVVMKQNTPEAVQEFASRVGADPEVVEVVADPKGAFTRLLGVEILEGPVKHHRCVLRCASAGLALDCACPLRVSLASAQFSFTEIRLDTQIHGSCRQWHSVEAQRGGKAEGLQQVQRGQDS